MYYICIEQMQQNKNTEKSSEDTGTTTSWMGIWDAQIDEINLDAKDEDGATATCGNVFTNSIFFLFLI